MRAYGIIGLRAPSSRFGAGGRLHGSGESTTERSAGEGATAAGNAPARLRTGASFPYHQGPPGTNERNSVSSTDELLQNNARYAEKYSKGDLPIPPRLGVAVVACMDARLDVSRALGLEEGDAHVIRNAGGVVSEDVIRSLTISQRLLGTREIVLIHHTDCGMLTFKDEEVKDAILAETGIRPPFTFEPFRDAKQDVRQSMARIQASPFVPHKDQIRGFVFEVESGNLREVEA
jgi:carbonic anhydrase